MPSVKKKREIANVKCRLYPSTAKRIAKRVKNGEARSAAELIDRWERGAPSRTT